MFDLPKVRLFFNLILMEDSSKGMVHWMNYWQLNISDTLRKDKFSFGNMSNS